MNPYLNLPVEHWFERTNELVDNHPLKNEIVTICLNSWQSILNGKINSFLNMSIKDMHISPQATGALLHDVIPEYISKNMLGFRKGQGNEKDVVCTTDEYFSFEIKTSSQKSIYGNRSYALSETGKSKSGYYLAINFEKIEANSPNILSIKFGWLDHSDWKAQKSETGQQASLTKEAKQFKLLQIYSK